jgi:hypothetical protein
MATVITVTVAARTTSPSHDPTRSQPLPATTPIATKPRLQIAQPATAR